MNQLLRSLFHRNLRFRRGIRPGGWTLSAAMVLLLANLGTAQILTNGGFESGLSSWTTSLTAGGAATFANTTSSVHSGTNALLVTVSAAGTASNSVRIISSSFIASNSDTYVLRFWANASVLNANMNVDIIGPSALPPTTSNMQIPFEIFTNLYSAGNETYEEYRFAFKASGPVQIAFNFGTVAQYWLDDVEVLDLTNNDGWDVPLTYSWQWGQWNFINTNNLKIGWTGGDNATSCQLPDGSVLWVLNDSWVTTPINFFSNIRGNSSLPRNCLLHQIGTNLIYMNNGANTFFTPANSTPQNQNAQQVQLVSGGLYWISGSVVDTNINKLYVLLLGVNNSPNTNLGMAVATFSLPGLTLDGGVVTNLSSPGIGDFGNPVVGDDGYTYTYDNKAETVARIPPGQLGVDSAWTYWNGSTWVTSHSQSVALSNYEGWSITRLSVSNYAAVYIPNLSLNIYVEFAPSPLGPWGNSLVIYSVPNKAGENIESGYAPNICEGTGSNGVYTVAYSDNDLLSLTGTPKVDADKSWYNPHFITAPLLAMSPYTSANIAANADYSFETPVVSGYSYDPSGGLWTFSGSGGNGSGIVANGSGFGNPNAPDGVQAAFVQETGTITQAIPGFFPGVNYTISFLAAERANNAQTWNVTVNGTVIGSFNPGSSATSYAFYTASFTATSTTQTVAFVGTDLAGGDNTVFIDDVRITAPTTPPVVNLSVQQARTNLVLSWPEGLLLQATNVTGPWTTNNVTSPYTTPPNNPRMFYRLRVE